MLINLNISVTIFVEGEHYFCKDQKVCSLSPLRVMGCALQTWPKSIKFVRGGKEQQQWVLPEDNYKEELGLYSKANEYQTLHKCSRGD